jgi:hypothetical protein
MSNLITDDITRTGNRLPELDPAAAANACNGQTQSMSVPLAD